MRDNAPSTAQVQSWPTQGALARPKLVCREKRQGFIPKRHECENGRVWFALHSGMFFFFFAPVHLARYSAVLLVQFFVLFRSRQLHLAEMKQQCISEVEAWFNTFGTFRIGNCLFCHGSLFSSSVLAELWTFHGRCCVNS